MARVTRDWLAVVGVLWIARLYFCETPTDFLISLFFLAIAWYPIYAVRKSYGDARAVPLPATPTGSKQVAALAGKTTAAKPAAVKTPFTNRPAIPTYPAADDVRLALVHLDYRSRDARRAVRLAVAAGAQDFESIFRAAQRELAR